MAKIQYKLNPNQTCNKNCIKIQRCIKIPENVDRNIIKATATQNTFLKYPLLTNIQETRFLISLRNSEELGSRVQADIQNPNLQSLQSIGKNMEAQAIYQYLEILIFHLVHEFGKIVSPAQSIIIIIIIIIITSKA